LLPPITIPDGFIKANSAQPLGGSPKVVSYQRFFRTMQAVQPNPTYCTNTFIDFPSVIGSSIGYRSVQRINGFGVALLIFQSEC
jgi:hypothetical protein